MTSGFARGAVTLLVAFLLAACGHSFTSSRPESSLLDPSQPRNPPFITISAAGVSPLVLHVDSPVTVTFTNNDGVAHRFESAPELGWDDCTELNALPTLEPGQHTALAMNRSGFVCAFHDAAQPANKTFQGYIALH